MEADQAVKFIERMFSHAAADRMAILAIPRSEGRRSSGCLPFRRRPRGRCRRGCGT